MPTHVRVDHLSEIFEVGSRSFALLALKSHTTRAVVYVHGFGGHPARTWSQFPELAPTTTAGWWESTDQYFIGYDSRRLDIRAASESLFGFLENLIPRPPEELFVYGRGRDAVKIRNVEQAYTELRLIGHSLGGVVVRDAILRALKPHFVKARAHKRASLKKARQRLAQDPQATMIASATVRLFAPAISGARLAGFLGHLQAFAIDFALAGSRSYKELQPESPVLRDIRRGTEDYAEVFDDIAALYADIAWAESDDVVTPTGYKYDNYGRRIPGTTHRTICKPRHYSDPRLLFVSD